MLYRGLVNWFTCHCFQSLGSSHMQRPRPLPIYLFSESRQTYLEVEVKVYCTQEAMIPAATTT